MGKLMVGVARILPLCTLISVFLSGIAVQPAYAKLGPISIRSVFTTDENQNNKNVFMSGDRPDKINYHVDVDNTTSSAFPIDIRFQAFANDYSPNPFLYHYDQTYRGIQMPVGLSRFYNPVTLPSDAVKYFYAVRITITPSGCNGTACSNDGDWGENTFTIQMTKAPAGTALNLIVLVHGCCTDAEDVKEWDQGKGTPRDLPGLAKVITDNIKQSRTTDAWEVVVWDWHEKTPKHNYIDPKELIFLKIDADTAYQAAKIQGVILANAIKLHRYQHVHFIGHSTGAKLIHDAATAYISDYFIRQQAPFIHLTFLDAYTPNEWDSKGQGSYGSLPTDYPNHYSEHYVDRTLSQVVPDWLTLTNSCLEKAFNFDVTGWGPDKDDRLGEFGHHWPRRWFQKSIEFAPAGSTPPGFVYGYHLSRESGYDRFDKLAVDYPSGQQCPVSVEGARCLPARCW